MPHSFIHLHNHSEYSILDGAIKVDDLVDAAFEAKMPAVALTDHGNIFGAVGFFKAARAKDIKPILGCEVYVAPRSRHEKNPGDRETPHYHLVLLVQNETGYRNLCRLLTKAYLEGFYYRPRIDKELLAQHSRGLIGLSSCLKGEIPVHLRGDQEARAVAAAERCSACVFSASTIASAASSFRAISTAMARSRSWRLRSRPACTCSISTKTPRQGG